jgi:hypothetical protein
MTPGRAAPPITDWTLRPFEATRLPPVAVGLVLVVIFVVASVATRLWLGLAASPYFWPDILNGALFAYVPTMVAYLRRGVLRDLEELRPVLTLDDAGHAAAAARATCVDLRVLTLYGVIGALLLSLMPLFDPALWPGGEPPPWSAPSMLFLVVRHAAIGWVAGHAIATEANMNAVVRRLGTSHTRIDLLDLRPLRIFARRAQRSVIAWIPYFCLIALFWLGPAAGSANGVIMIGSLTLIALGFFGSVYGVHGKIVQAKRSALDELREEIRQERSSLLSASESAGVGTPRLANLIAYQGLIERTPEWPFGAPTLVRVALLAMLGVASWLGGAMVERLLEAALA